MKNLILVISNKNSICSDFFYNTLISHKNIQKVKINTYDKADKYFIAKNTKPDYLKNPKFYCEKLDYDYQLSFKPFLEHFIFFFVIDKPKNIIKTKDDDNYFVLRLRRMYELIIKTKGRNKVFFDQEVYENKTYEICRSFLKIKDGFKLKNYEKEETSKYIRNQITEDFYDNYKSKINKYL